MGQIPFLARPTLSRDHLGSISWAWERREPPETQSYCFIPEGTDEDAALGARLRARAREVENREQDPGRGAGDQSAGSGEQDPGSGSRTWGTDHGILTAEQRPGWRAAQAGPPRKGKAGALRLPPLGHFLHRSRTEEVSSSQWFASPPPGRGVRGG